MKRVNIITLAILTAIVLFLLSNPIKLTAPIDLPPKSGMPPPPNIDPERPTAVGAVRGHQEEKDN